MPFPALHLVYILFLDPGGYTHCTAHSTLFPAPAVPLVGPCASDCTVTGLPLPAYSCTFVFCVHTTHAWVPLGPLLTPPCSFTGYGTTFFWIPDCFCGGLHSRCTGYSVYTDYLLLQFHALLLLVGSTFSIQDSPGFSHTAHLSTCSCCLRLHLLHLHSHCCTARIIDSSDSRSGFLTGSHLDIGRIPLHRITGYTWELGSSLHATGHTAHHVFLVTASSLQFLVPTQVSCSLRHSRTPSDHASLHLHLTASASRFSDHWISCHHTSPAFLRWDAHPLFFPTPLWVFCTAHHIHHTTAHWD